MFQRGRRPTGGVLCQPSSTLQVGKRRQQTGSLMKGCSGAMFYPSAVTSLGQTRQSAAPLPLPSTPMAASFIIACHHTVSVSFQLFLQLPPHNTHHKLCCTSSPSSASLPKASKRKVSVTCRDGSRRLAWGVSVLSQECSGFVFFFYSNSSLFLKHCCNTLCPGVASARAEQTKSTALFIHGDNSWFPVGPDNSATCTFTRGGGLQPWVRLIGWWLWCHESLDYI